MVDKNTDFFKIEDNFAKTKNIVSNPIIQSKLGFEPKVTIAIPTYKRADLLKEALDSAINQIDYDEYEIIVVDNNPERGCETEQLMNFYNNPNISYYKNAENIGMFGNWNRCVELSKGKYLTVLNDDDLLDSNYLFRTNSFVGIYGDVDVLLVGFEIFTMISDVVFQRKLVSKNIQRAKFINLLFGNINPGSLGVLFKKRVLLEIGGFNEAFYPISDYATWLTILNRYKNVFILSEKLAYYRMSVNESLKTEIQERNILCCNILRDQLPEKIKKLKFFINAALPVFSYFHLKDVSQYSVDFGTKYANKLSEVKSNLSFRNYMCYYVLSLIRKIQNRYSKVILFHLSRKY